MNQSCYYACMSKYHTCTKALRSYLFQNQDKAFPLSRGLSCVHADSTWDHRPSRPTPRTRSTVHRPETKEGETRGMERTRLFELGFELETLPVRVHYLSTRNILPSADFLPLPSFMLPPLPPPLPPREAETSSVA